MERVGWVGDAVGIWLCEPLCSCTSKVDAKIDKQGRGSRSVDWGLGMAGVVGGGKPRTAILQGSSHMRGLDC